MLWFIGRRTIGAPAATIAVALLMFWPMWIVWKSTRAHGFYGALVLLGLLVVLLTLKLDERPTQWTAVGLGLAIGLGWWTNAQIALVVVPCLAWLVARRSLRHPILLGVSAVVGAEPWLMWNIQNNWDSLKIGRDLPDSTYFEHLRTFFTDVFPIALALRAPETPGWLFTTTTFAWTLHLIALGILVWALTKAWRSGGPMLLISIIVVAYPFLYSLSPFTWYLSEPRYLILLIPFVALLFAWLLRRSAIATILVASFMASLSVVGIWAATENDALTPDIVGTVVPTDMDPLVARLDRLEVRYVYAHYWIAYRLAFESDERIIATAPEFPRYPPFNDAVNAAEAEAAHVFVEGTPDDPAFAEEHGSGYRRMTTGGFVIYVPKDSRLSR